MTSWSFEHELQQKTALLNRAVFRLAGADRNIFACALRLLAVRSFFFLVGHKGESSKCTSF